MGYAIGAPLDALASIWGASLLLVAVGIIGVLVLTGISVRDAARLCRRALAAVGRSLTRALDIALGHERDDADVAGEPVISINGSTTALFDQDDEIHGREGAPAVGDEPVEPGIAIGLHPRRTPGAPLELLPPGRLMGPPLRFLSEHGCRQVVQLEDESMAEHRAIAE